MSVIYITDDSVHNNSVNVEFIQNCALVNSASILTLLKRSDTNQVARSVVSPGGLLTTLHLQVFLLLYEVFCNMEFSL